MRRFERVAGEGKKFFPAFVMISINEACNLTCNGCWVSAGGKKMLTPQQLHGIINTCKAEGSRFFGILGGEPLLYKELTDVLGRHSDCYFQLFTNGILLTDDVAQQWRRLGNVTPLVSSLRGLQACKKAGLIFGVAACVNQTNFEQVVSRQYIEQVAGEGAAYLWYYIYRPVGAHPHPEVALTAQQIQQLRQFLVEQRCDAPLALIDTYWDAEGVAMCPGATGMSHHISPSGALEFCPPMQMACEYINETGTDVATLYKESELLAHLRSRIAQHGRGCILMENPQLLAQLLREQGATDTTSRQTVMDEYTHMTTVPGHDMGTAAIPEKSAPYRWLKRHYFFGFGAYG